MDGDGVGVGLGVTVGDGVGLGERESDAVSEESASGMVTVERSSHKLLIR